MADILYEAIEIVERSTNSAIIGYLSEEVEKNNDLLGYGILPKTSAVTLYLHPQISDEARDKLIGEMLKAVPHIQSIDFEYGPPRIM